MYSNSKNLCNSKMDFIEILEIMCDRKCSMKLEDLQNGCSFDVLPEINAYPNIFSTDDRDGDCIVTARSPVQLCADYFTKHGCQIPNVCGKLHVCKYFIVGTECSHSECQFGHDLGNAHNMKVLMSQQIERLSLYDLQVLMRKSLASLPPICKFYNHAGGCKRKNCRALHVCRYYVLGSCTFGHKKCWRSHNILDGQPCELLIKNGIDVRRTPKEILDELGPAYLKQKQEASDNESLDSDRLSCTDELAAARPNNSESDDDQLGANAAAAKTDHRVPNNSDVDGSANNNDTSDDYGAACARDADSAECAEEEEENAIDVENAICLFFFRNRCKQGQNCKRKHCNLPYQWQWKNGQMWTNFPESNNMAIERKFCNPGVAEHTLSVERFGTATINFNTLTMHCVDEHRSVRRLSTLSSVRRPTMEHTTVWRWFSVSDYDDDDDLQPRSPVALSDELTTSLEEAYVKSGTRGRQYVTDDRQKRWHVKFDEMTMTNQDHVTKHLMRRPAPPSSASYNASNPAGTRRGTLQQRPPSPRTPPVPKVPTQRTYSQSSRVPRAMPAYTMSPYSLEPHLRLQPHQYMPGPPFLRPPPPGPPLMAPSLLGPGLRGPPLPGPPLLGPRPPLLGQPLPGPPLFVAASPIPGQAMVGGSLPERSSESPRHVPETLPREPESPSHEPETPPQKVRVEKSGTAAHSANSKTSVADRLKYSSLIKTQPKYWKADYPTHPFYQQVELSRTSEETAHEYMFIERCFMKTSPDGCTITGIRRIQNLELWDAYCRKKDSMNVRGPVTEMDLFHAAKSEHVDAIGRQGFDWHVIGLAMSSSTYGQGSYFTNDVQFAAQRAPDGLIFVAKVLVGEYTVGKRKYIEPPPCDNSQPGGPRFDSCVDNTTKPKHFVIFAHDQAYPAYLLRIATAGPESRTARPESAKHAAPKRPTPQYM